MAFEIPFQNLTYSILVERILAFKSPQWYMLNSSSRYYPGYDTSPHLSYNASFSLVFATLNKFLGYCVKLKSTCETMYFVGARNKVKCKAII